MTQSKRGGDHGGGPIPRRLTLTPAAAQFVRQRATITGTRATTEAMQTTASQVLEAMADGTLVWFLSTPEAEAAAAWLQVADAPAEVRRGLDQMIAAILVAHAAHARQKEGTP